MCAGMPHLALGAYRAIFLLVGTTQYILQNFHGRAGHAEKFPVTLLLEQANRYFKGHHKENNTDSRCNYLIVNRLFQPIQLFKCLLITSVAAAIKPSRSMNAVIRCECRRIRLRFYAQQSLLKMSPTHLLYCHVVTHSRQCCLLT